MNDDTSENSPGCIICLSVWADVLRPSQHFVIKFVGAVSWAVLCNKEMVSSSRTIYRADGEIRNHAYGYDTLPNEI